MKKCVGQYKNDLRNGQGTNIYLNGEKYIGEHKDGLKNDLGTYIYPDGNKYDGEWKDGKPWNLTIYDKNGNIIGKWVNGVRQ